MHTIQDGQLWRRHYWNRSSECYFELSKRGVHCDTDASSLFTIRRVESMRGPARVSNVRVSAAESNCRLRKTLEVQSLPSDIDACVSFSLIRCVISIISIALLLTDIPRTGLYIDLLRYYRKVGPDTTMSYGPYAYPVAHLNRTNRTDALSPIAGYSGDSTLAALEVWSYKFDSLSIPTRALAKHLNVSSYPPCILYKEPCTRSTLDLDTGFTMLNDLMSAIDTEYFSLEALRHLPIAFYTTSNWADRLHHVILGEYGRRIDVRLHTVYRFAVKNDTVGVDVCDPQSAVESDHPLVCKTPIKWLCDHPFLRTQEQVTLATSVQLRVAALQELYPEAQLDVTMITTRNEIESPPSIIPTVFFRGDNTEITTFVRARDCLSGSPCTTIFLDDYRYERLTLQTSSEHFQVLTAILRAVSQAYMWLRVVLLFYICWQTRLAEQKYLHASLAVKIRAVVITVAKIPSHLIVYSSWFPIIGYSIAHFVDCDVTHFISDSFWASAQGFFSFDFMRYIEVSSIQMRNIWIIALLWKCGIAIYNRVVNPRARPWQPQQGLVAFRGIFMGAMSFLTIFTFLRALRFRDSRVIGFFEVERNRGAASERLAQLLHTSSTDYGYPVDVKATSVAIVTVVAVVYLVRSVSWVSWKSETRSFFCRTLYVPLSTGVLFPTSALHPYWPMQLLRGQASRVTSPEAGLHPDFVHAPSVSSPALSAVFPLGLRSRGQHCDTCEFIPTALHWRAVQGCRRHETIFDIGRRSVETQSMVRLIHIGVFSDPIVFFQLRVLGKRLYLYRVRKRNAAGDGRSAPACVDTDCTAFLSPVRLHSKGMESSPTAFHATRDKSVAYELIGHVSSASVRWTHLVDCG